eukprot:7165723-Alexandrium_andersonii.AAC.1
MARHRANMAAKLPTASRAWNCWRSCRASCTLSSASHRGPSCRLTCRFRCAPDPHVPGRSLKSGPC